MGQGRQTKLNILVALAYQVVTAVCSLLLPRFILRSYGSEVNGLMQTICQMLSYTVLLEGGIGGVMRAALYKPLAEQDTSAVSDIFHYIKRFFKKISFVFIGFAIVLSVVTKFVIVTDFDWLYVCTMVLILSLNTYFGYYFAMPHQILMRADQKLYIVQFTQIIATVLNLGICILAMHLGAGVHLVKLISALVYLLNPLLFRIYVRKHYAICKNVEDETRQLPQKMDGLVHHLAYFVHRNTDVIILSVFTDVRNVSVYTVYNAVMQVMEQFLSSISSGIAGAIGRLIALDEKKELQQTVNVYEAFNTALTAAISAVAAILILPFVSVYTAGVYDAQYRQPVFALLMIAAGFMYCIRIPYWTVISAAGHYAQTKKGALAEMFLNLALSLLLVKPFGLVGIAIGTLVAMAYRTIHTVWYLSKNILNRPMVRFVRSALLNLLLCIALVFAFMKYVNISAETIWGVAAYAMLLSLIVFPLFGLLNLLLERNLIKKLTALLGKR